MSFDSLVPDDVASLIEGRDRADVLAWQTVKTREQIAWVRGRSDFWRVALGARRLTEADLHQADDFHGFPFLTKAEYRAAIEKSPPYGGFLCARREELGRQTSYLFRTTGTTGRQTSILKSREELRWFAIAGARNMAIADVRAGDHVLMTFPFTLWTAAWGFYHGAPLIGATVIPAAAPLDTAGRVALLQEYRPRALVCTPSYALAFAEAVRRSGVDPEQQGVGLILVGGEPLSTARRHRIEAAWDAPGAVRNFSGISEVASVYLGVECEAQDGMHSYEDLVRCDVLVPGQATEASEAAGGELVVTSLVPTALALNFHFRTGDFVRFTDQACRCGRTSRRLLSIESRLDDMRKIRGINIWASAIEDLLHSVEGAGGEFELVLDRVEELDEVTIRVEATQSVPRTGYAELARLIESRLKAYLTIRLPVEVVEPGVLPRYELKAKRWIDRRPAD